MTAASQAGVRPKSPGNSQTEDRSPIERGFDLLYSLKFAQARDLFAGWKQSHPNDPIGDVSLAAGYLFEEFHQQQVLTSECFLDDDRLLGGIAGRPDEIRKTAFNEANQRARELSHRRLKTNPRDPDALFAMTLVSGMQANYASILEKRQLESLRLIKEARNYSKKLLEVKPDAADAWLAIGAANYIVGCMPAYKRFFVWLGGMRGDKRAGMEQLAITAEKGNYLKPFAKIFLALAALREKQEGLARRQFTDLVARYPDNPLFAAELARLDRPRPPEISPSH